MTWPQGTAKWAFVPDERDFLQAGHIMVGSSVELEAEVENETGMIVFKDRGWAVVGVEAGHTRDTLRVLAEARSDDGVCDGIQKEGSDCFGAWSMG